MREPLTLDFFADRFSGPAVVAGNGPSLRAIPDDFLCQYPLFSCNFFPVHRKILPTFNVMIDRVVVESAKVRAIGARTWELVWWCFHPDLRGDEFNRPNVIFWKAEEIKGFAHSSKYGTVFTSSAHAAAYCASIMGFNPILLVGVDCTRVPGIQTFDVDEDGRGMIPHFYDVDETISQPSILWNIAWSEFDYWIDGRGGQIINLSPQTECYMLQKGDWHDFYARPK